MSNKSNWLPRIAWTVCALLGVVLSLKALREPDLWWMYRTGEWMWENGAVTREDMFSYTMSEVPWINVKWFYEVIMVVFKKIGGPEFWFMMQVIVTLIILTLIRKITARVAIDNYEKETLKPAWILAFVGALLVCDFRIIGRPEMVSHTMTLSYLYLWLRNRQKPDSKWVFAIISLQLLWANLHEAFGVGMVLLVILMISDWLEFGLRRWTGDEAKMPVKFSIATVGAWAAVSINPRGPEMIMHPFNIFTQLQENKFTTELDDYTTIAYWSWEAYTSMIVFAIVLVGVLWTTWSAARKSTQQQGFKAWLSELMQRFGLGYAAIFLAMFYLSLTAYRNIPFFIWVSTPLIALFLGKLLSRLKQEKIKWGVAIAVSLGAYVMVVSGQFYKMKGSHDYYGLQVLSSHNPVGASKFIKENNIKGTCFSDYLTSAYLLWDLQPDFKTYIDLRDLDIFSKEFFADFSDLIMNPSLIEKQDSIYNFDYAVVFRPQFATIHQYLLNSSEYDLVFVDPVAAVYLKQNDKHQALIQRYGFKANGNKDIFSKLPESSCSGLSYTVSKVFNPLYQIEDYKDLDYDAIRGSFYQSLGLVDMALEAAQASVKNGKEKWASYELLGNIYNSIAFSPNTPDADRQKYMDEAFRAYENSLRKKKDHLPAILGKATVQLQSMQFDKAIPILKKALKIDANSFPANQYMAICYKMQVSSGKATKKNIENWIKYATILLEMNPENPAMILDLGIAYGADNDCENAMYYLNKVEGTPGLPVEESKTADRYRKECRGG